MAGHSKWKNIMHKKEKTDAQRAKIFTKIGREITVVVREGGPDPASNAKLRDLIAKAKQNNVPNDNIDRIIKKASGAGEKQHYETMIYEGYGPSGVAVIVECLTDNKNRTAADVRHAFDKYGGNLGTSGCVSYLFSRKGVILLALEGRTEDTIMEDCMEVGAEDFQIDLEADGIEVQTPPNDCGRIREAFEAKGYQVLSSEVEQLPSTTVTLTDPDEIKKFSILLEKLEENDDVQQIFHNGNESV